MLFIMHYTISKNDLMHFLNISKNVYYYLNSYCYVFMNFYYAFLNI